MESLSTVKAAAKVGPNLGRGVATTSAVDAFYLCYLFCVVIMSTLGYSASDLAYQVLVALGAVFALVRICALRFDGRFLAIAMGLVALSAVEFVVSDRFTLLLTTLLLVSAKGIGTKTLMRAFLSAKVVGLLALGVLVLTGVYEVEYYQYYKIVSGSYVQRMTINGSGTTIIHLSLIVCMTLWFYLREGRVSPAYYLSCVALNLYFYSFAKTTMGVVMGFFCIVVFFFCQKSEWVRGLFVRATPWAIPLLLAFSFGTAALYGGNGAVDWLDKLSQGRIYYNHYFLTSYPFSLFGHGMLTNEGNFDNSFVFVWVAYGAVTFVVLFVSMWAVISRAAGRADWVTLALAVVFLVVGLSESFYPSAAVNPSLFLLVTLFETPGGRRPTGEAVSAPLSRRGVGK